MIRLKSKGFNIPVHGTCKGRAAIFNENGASVEQRLAWLGQETEEEARRYSLSADLKKVISTSV